MSVTELEPEMGVEHLPDLRYPDGDPPCHFCCQQTSTSIHDENRLKIVSGGECQVWQYECPAATDILAPSSVGSSLLKTVSGTLKGMLPIVKTRVGRQKHAPFWVQA